jgi:trk system potassium uptake protein TrkA
VRIIIVGDGKVGYTLAERLSAEEHGVTIIDRNEEALKRASENLDVMCVKGHGASLSVLQEAGVEKTDVLIAVTQNDEMNMVVCLTGKKLGARHTVARIRDPEYAGELRHLKEQLDINLVVNPEQSTAVEILRLLRFPHADTIDTFSRGRVELVSFRALPDDVLVGQKLASLKTRMDMAVLICMVERGAEVFIPDGEFVIREDDTVYVIGGLPEISRLFKWMGRLGGVARNVMIVGGGRIGYYLAQGASKMGIQPRVIELNAEVAAQLAEDLPDAVIIHGDGTVQELLESENIRGADSFVAVTGRDEDNLMTALFALQCKVPKVVAKTNRQNFNAVVRALGLDSVISPKDITADHIMHFIRGLNTDASSRVETLYRLVDGRVEALEFLVGRGSRHLGKKIMELPLKKSLLLGAISRRGHIIIPSGTDHLAEGDTLIVITTHKGFTELDDIFTVLPRAAAPNAP